MVKSMAISKQEFDRRVERFTEQCRCSGMKVTHQRMEVFRELAGTAEHPDAESIYQAVSSRLPAISRDTVYRTLSMLEEAGLVKKAQALAGPARYDANIDRHHHFVCTECGLVRDIFSETLDKLPVPPAAQRVGRVLSTHVQLQGICAACAAGKREKKRGS